MGIKISTLTARAPSTSDYAVVETAGNKTELVTLSNLASHFKGDKGESNRYYQPSVSSSGTISWTTHGSGLPAVSSISGLKGATGPKGDTGSRGSNGVEYPSYGYGGSSYTDSLGSKHGAMLFKYGGIVEVCGRGQLSYLVGDSQSGNIGKRWNWSSGTVDKECRPFFQVSIMFATGILTFMPDGAAHYMLTVNVDNANIMDGSGHGWYFCQGYW